jgi:imidazolonepropionase-like amidohydrolase
LGSQRGVAAVLAAKTIRPDYISGDSFRYLVITGGKVAGLAKTAAEAARWAGPSARPVDLGDACVGPGFIDTHIHALQAAADARLVSLRDAATIDGLLAAVRAAGLRRQHGEWTVSGRALVCTGGHGHESSSTLECDGPDGFVRGTRAQIKAGADLIKVMISGGIAGVNETMDTVPLTPDELSAVIFTAHAWGRKVTAHAGPARIIGPAVEQGLDCVEHGYQLTEAVARQMRDRGVTLVPTLSVTRCGDFFDSLGVPAWMRERSLGAAPEHERSYRLALAAGVPVMLGSDIPPFWQIDGTSATVRELEHMEAFGLPAGDALLAATRVPAAWLGIDEQVGSVESGKRADLIAMRDDPTATVAALRTLHWVMKDGRVCRDDAWTR